MRINSIQNQTFQSKLPPVKPFFTNSVRKDAWEEFVKAAWKEELWAEVESSLNTVAKDGHDECIFALDKYTSSCNIENYYLGLYKDTESLMKDRSSSSLMSPNTISKKFVWFQKDSDGLYKIPNTSLRDPEVLGKSFPKAVLTLLKRISDNATFEHKKIYGFDKPIVEHFLNKYRAKI